MEEKTETQQWSNLPMDIAYVSGRVEIDMQASASYWKGNALNPMLYYLWALSLIKKLCKGFLDVGIQGVLETQT